MASVAIHPPKTPVTEGSSGTARATLPNVCKMPGPPAPFVPSPLPNIATSGSSPSGYSTTVKIEGNAVAIRGATFDSTGDEASKGTGGGLLSANTQGPAKFITPGSMTVQIEGKSVHLLGEPMLNNCGPGGSPPNTGATLMGLDQDDLELQGIIDWICEQFCDELAEGWESSKKFEQQLKYGAPEGYEFHFPPESSTTVDWAGDEIPETIPDCALCNDEGEVVQCFDFKGPGDRPRDDQYWRQTQVAGRPLIYISAETCGCETE